MAKMFYTLDEAASKLGKSTEEVMKMVQTGQLQEFRDRDRHMFKVEQVDLLAGGGDDDGSFKLASGDSGEAISLVSDSGSGFNLESPKEQSGISIFDAEDAEAADPSAQTQITDTGATDLALDPGGSGTGLLDLTREVDDSTLGQEFLEGGYSDQGAPAGGGGGALFEGSAGDSEAVGIPAMALAAEPYDGAGSGMAGGAALGMIAVLLLSISIVIGAMAGGFGGLLATIGGNFWAFVGGMAGAIVLLMLVGWFLGKKS